ncbi:MAG: DUF465 domain-containing protein [Paracoccaceae bacterium]|nr:DUF465 domain-containing protein [Paracoccaceae bacterium]
MTHVPHDLAADFPEHSDRIHNLRETNGHFQRLYTEYEEVNHAVHRAETRLDTMTEEAENELRHRRASLKDELYRMLTAPA